jgi:hypothetical protein
MFSYTRMMNMYIESDNHYFSLFIQASFNSDFHAFPFSSVFQTIYFFFFCWFAVNLLAPATVLIFSDPWLGSLFSYLSFFPSTTSLASLSTFSLLTLLSIFIPIPHSSHVHLQFVCWWPKDGQQSSRQKKCSQSLNPVNNVLENLQSVDV